MKILITGGAGYIGSVLTPRLLDRNYEVTILDNFMFNQLTLTESCKYDKFDVIKGDTRDKELLKSIIPKFDVIIPLAALVGAPMCNLDPTGAKTINQDAVENIINITSKEQIILMPVSNSGYGVGEKDKYCDEESPLNPISLYGITKVKAEQMVLERGNSATFRLATVFGMSSRMRLDLLVNDFVFRAVNDRTLVIFEGHFKRNYIHIQDVANVFLYAMENFQSMRGKAYNVGLDDANLSKIELANEIKKHVPNFVFLEAPIGEDPDKRDYIVSNKRLADTGFKTEWDLNRGIKELIKGYKMIRNSIHSNV
jgi:nucleoside-diphosphate-sugar epimerase|tara:strand:- start:464 stop:1396 length:933 start_codon:yes stop_codon:yes gene_type:complete